jgi:ribosome biogenesis protein BMS1
LKLPKKLVKELPFASKPKLMQRQKRQSLEHRRAVIQNTEEKKMSTLIQNINTIRNEKERKAKIVKEQKRKEYLKKKGKVEEMDLIMQKKRKKEGMKEEGQKRQRLENKGKRVFKRKSGDAE